MTHNEWLDKLKQHYDRYGLGYHNSHWQTFSDEICYKNFISDLDVIIFYYLAVRN